MTAALFTIIAAALAADPPAPFGAIPSPSQLAWHDLEFCAFFHFSINTFTDKEWGYGDESPALFNPTELDCSQWAKIAADAGMKGVILTAKHHDGFCLWPSELTKHSVASSPWKSGRGDVVRELSDAARARNLKFGLYLSPWDRNHAAYGSPDYIAYYRAQWQDLGTRYGPLFEAWQDGANGGDGFYGGAREARTIDRASYYDWPETNRLLLHANPGLIIFSDAGPGCRWVGNERGCSDETSWQTINLAGMYPGVSHDHLARGDKLGSHWVGVECDVSIRPGWFYHPAEDDKVKMPAELAEIWYNSVGRGANLLLNIPPDRRGLIHENDITALHGMRYLLDATFKTDLARTGTATSSAVRAGDPRFAPANLLDNDNATYWSTDDSTTHAEAVIDLAEETTFDTARVKEAIPLGQRIEEFAIDAWIDNAWKELARGTTIGPRRILRFDPVKSSRVRLRIENSLACPAISEFALFKRP